MGVFAAISIEVKKGMTNAARNGRPHQHRPFFYLASQQTSMNLMNRKKGNYNNEGNRACAVYEKLPCFHPPKDPRLLVENLVRVILGRLLSENLARTDFERVHRFARDYVVEEIERMFSQYT